jgi:hypothetical protein
MNHRGCLRQHQRQNTSQSQRQRQRLQCGLSLDPRVHQTMFSAARPKTSPDPLQTLAARASMRGSIYRWFGGRGRLPCDCHAIGMRLLCDSHAIGMRFACESHKELFCF